MNKIAVLPGDGIGPEIMQSTLAILQLQFIEYVWIFLLNFTLLVLHGMKFYRKEMK